MAWPDDDLQNPEKLMKITFPETDKSLKPSGKRKGRGKRRSARKVVPESEEFSDSLHQQDSGDVLASFFRWLFFPSFDELSVGLMSYLIALTLIFLPEFWKFIADFWNDKPLYLLVIGILYFRMASMSIYHVFADVPKDAATKRQLAVFAAICCIFGGILGGYQLIATGPNSLLQLFGAWIMLQGLVLTMLLKFEYIDEKSFSDRDTPFLGAIFNFGIITLLYFVLSSIFELHVIDVFSICVAYAASFSTFICNQISPMQDQKRELSDRKDQSAHIA